MKKVRELLRKPKTYVLLAVVFGALGVSTDEAALSKIGTGIEAVLELVQPTQ